MDEYITISKAAKLLGLSDTTLRSLDKQGKLHPIRTEGGIRRFSMEEIIAYRKDTTKEPRITICYARVSTWDQKDDLEVQKRMLESYAAARGYQFKVVQDLCSGLNYDRKGLTEVLQDIGLHRISRIVITYKDRLFRFGFELFEAFCRINGVVVEIINHTEDKSHEEELVEDVLSILTVFSARLHGSRSHKNKRVRESLMKALELEPKQS